MVPSQEHAFYMWLIIIGCVCIAAFIGAMIDRFFLYRRLRQQHEYFKRVAEQQLHADNGRQG